MNCALLERTVVQARDAAEQAALDALETLAVTSPETFRRLRLVGAQLLLVQVQRLLALLRCRLATRRVDVEHALAAVDERIPLTARHRRDLRAQNVRERSRANPPAWRSR